MRSACSAVQHGSDTFGTGDGEGMWSPRNEPRESTCDVGPRPGIAHGPHTVLEGRAVAMIT